MDFSINGRIPHLFSGTMSPAQFTFRLIAGIIPIRCSSSNGFTRKGRRVNLMRAVLVPEVQINQLQVRLAAIVWGYTHLLSCSKGCRFREKIVLPHKKNKSRQSDPSQPPGLYLLPGHAHLRNRISSWATHLSVARSD